MTDFTPFFDYARKRYGIFLARQNGEAAPWTDDPILQRFRFCNVFREDDTTTRWIRKHVTLGGYGNFLLGAMIIARWFNRIETLELLLGPKPLRTPYFDNNLLYCWDDLPAWKQKMRDRLEGVKPIVTGAYMIKTPAGMNKLEGLLECLGHILPDAVHIQCHVDGCEPTLEEFTVFLQSYPYLGPFMAYEVVTDLRHTILKEAEDIMTWANPGPGCTRGISRLWYGDTDSLNRHNQEDYKFMQQCMQEILAASKDPKYWPQHWPDAWPPWEMRDVEHTLCEMDKYQRALLGQGTPKQRYAGGGA